MADIIIEDVQFKRGLKANLPVLRAGEPAFTNDSGNESFFVGNGTSNIEMAKQKDMDSNVQLADKAGLSGWLRNGTQNKKIVFVGDSTTDVAPALYSELTNYHANSGDKLEGCTFINMGSSGNTCANFINNLPSGKGINDVIALQADLYVLSYGINDVRLGLTTQQQMIDLLTTVIKRLLKETKAYILLRTPNSFLTTDPGNYNFIQPIESAQAYTDLLWNTYESFRGKYPRTDVIDMQTLIFGRTCPSTSIYMLNSLHPNDLGYTYIADQIAEYIGYPKLIQPHMIKKAHSDNPSQPWLVYPKILETSDYIEIASGYFKNMTASYIEFNLPFLSPNMFMVNDIVKIGDKMAYGINGSITQGVDANSTRINQTFTYFAENNKGMVKIYRSKKKLLNSETYTPTLLLNWVSDSSRPLRVLKDGLGRVSLEGAIKSGTVGSGNVAFVLPNGWRPIQNIMIPVITSTTFDVLGTIYIDTNGNVTVFKGDNGSVDFSSCSFSTK